MHRCLPPDSQSSLVDAKVDLVIFSDSLIKGGKKAHASFLSPIPIIISKRKQVHYHICHICGLIARRSRVLVSTWNSRARARAIRGSSRPVCPVESAYERAWRERWYCRSAALRWPAITGGRWRAPRRSRRQNLRLLCASARGWFLSRCINSGRT